MNLRCLDGRLTLAVQSVALSTESLVHIDRNSKARSNSTAPSNATPISFLLKVTDNIPYKSVWLCARHHFLGL